ncbi:Kelch repeat type 1 [Echinococcus multilocularis]|uniref:Kelch repeat type 1 n=1 Tax=Echinococcus multilocularis TaxID=6211 RepID=A0A068XTD1_ECHMU|nr:Kelch repeat type 1 [Echinococcus multilocularis]
MLVEDPSGESGWRWIKLNPMLEGRFRPGVAHFRGCVIVAGGDHLGKKITVECLPLTSVEPPTAPQWTCLHGVDKQCTPFTSLVTFGNRLIMLSSGWRGCDAYEFSPTEGDDNSLANFTWKSLFHVNDLEHARILVTSERLDGS